MTTTKIDRLGKIITEINRLEDEAKRLKEEARKEGEGSLVGKRYVVIVGKDCIIPPKFNLKKWQVAEPEAYAEAFSNYHTEATMRAAPVTAKPIANR